MLVLFLFRLASYFLLLFEVEVLESCLEVRDDGAGAVACYIL